MKIFGKICEWMTCSVFFQKFAKIRVYIYAAGWKENEVLFSFLQLAPPSTLFPLTSHTTGSSCSPARRHPVLDSPLLSASPVTRLTTRCSLQIDTPQPQRCRTKPPTPTDKRIHPRRHSRLRQLDFTSLIRSNPSKILGN